MDFAANYLTCLKRCHRRKQVQSPRPDMLCDFDGLSVLDHAMKNSCGDPNFDRYAAAEAAAARASTGEAGAQTQAACTTCGGETLAEAKRRVELLAPICQGCDQMVSITVRENPLAAGVLCKATPACCGGGPGTIDLVYGACIELKHEAAIAQWESEREGGAACH